MPPMQMRNGFHAGISEQNVTSLELEIVRDCKHNLPDFCADKLQVWHPNGFVAVPISSEVRGINIVPWVR